MLKTLVFKVINRCAVFVYERRAEYFAYRYKSQVELRGYVRMGYGSSIYIPTRDMSSYMKINNGTTFRRFCTLTLDGCGKLNLGEHNFFNNNCSINCLGTITIGNNNLFGEGVKIYDHNHRFSNPNELIARQGFSLGQVTIGNNCWIGSNTVILNNVVIGNNVIIGANNLIYTSIPDNAIVKSNISGSISYYM